MSQNLVPVGQLYLKYRVREAFGHNAFYFDYIRFGQGSTLLTLLKRLQTRSDFRVGNRLSA